MEKEMTLGNSRSQMQDAMESVWKQVCRPAEWLRSYFSQVLEREVSMRQTMAILNAQVAGTVAVFFAFSSVLLHIAAMAWFVVALLQCRK
jgi:hypothetical protein